MKQFYAMVLLFLLVASLASKGHELTVTGDFSNQMGGGQAVIYDSATGVKYGASDPRKDGSAVPEPHPYFKN